MRIRNLVLAYRQVPQLPNLLRCSCAQSSTSSGSGQLLDDFHINIPSASSENVSLQRVKKISRAMEAYLVKAKQQEIFVKKEVEEFELGKRHLANMMSLDPDTMTQEDIDKAIAYLLPSGLFDKKARPMMKHPSELWAQRKMVEFGVDGRPFHFLFYTMRPNFYQVIHDIAEKLEHLRTFETRQYQAGIKDIEEQLILTGSDWIKQPELETILLEKLTEDQYNQFLIAMNNLTEMSYAFREREFIMKFRKSIGTKEMKEQAEIPELQVDDKGRSFAVAQGRRRNCNAEAKLWSKGTGKITVDGKELEDWRWQQSREILLFPFVLLDRLGQFDVVATTDGGGETGKVGAVRLATSKALCAFVEKEEIEKLRLAGLLTRDPRRLERHKPGQKGARAKWIWKRR